MLTAERKSAMDFFEQTERVIDYIENNLFSVRYGAIAKITGIPAGLYQRVFNCVYGVTLAEYIRKRRITISGEWVLARRKPVTEIALDCGYETHSTFTRAFREHFGVPPTKLTADILNRKAYGRFFFREEESYTVMKGRKMMASIVKIDYEEDSEALLIGVSSRRYGVAGRALWDMFFSEGFDKKLFELNALQRADMDDYIGVGYMSDFSDENALGNEYIVGRYFSLNTPVPEGMTAKIIRKGTVAKARIKGANFEDILNSAYVLMEDMVKKNGYVLDYENFYWTEVYTCSRFCEPLEQGAREIICDWYMPCRKQV